MKIGIIAHTHFPIAQPFAGGLEAHTWNLVKTLESKGHDVTLFASEGSDESLPLETFCEPTMGRPYGRIEENAQYREERYKVLMNKLANSNFDIIHNNSLHYTPIENAKNLPVPMVTVLHTPPTGRIAKALNDNADNPSQHVIAISEHTAKVWQEAAPNILTNIVHNGIDTDSWKPHNKIVTANYAVWCGRICPEKGTHLAIQAARIAGIPLMLCGKKFKHDYFDKHVAPYLSNSVQYLGNLPIQSLRKIVAGADVSLCTPCWNEPFGLVVAESLACGTPVAGFKRGALPEILDEKTGVLVDEDANLLADAIKQASTLQSKDCVERIKTHFSHETMVDQYCRVYQDAIIKHQAARTSLVFSMAAVA